MRLGIMQPYFFPYLGYFDLINCTDRWIVFDTAQYIRHGWVNRNRILHPTQGWQYIIAPLRKHDFTVPIREIEVAADAGWRKRILGQIQHYKKRAPYFDQTRDLIEGCFDDAEKSLARLNTAILAKVCHYLGITFKFDFLSTMNLALDPIEEPGDWALQISRTLGASEYVNPPGGAEIFDRRKFEDASVKLTLRKLPRLEYATPGYEFVADLSIIDLLMWNAPCVIKLHLDAYHTQ